MLNLFRSFALLVAILSVSGVRLAAQDQTSVADAARQARQQKQAAAKPAPVVDNDTLNPQSSAATTPENPPAPDSSAQAGSAPTTSDATEAKEDAGQNKDEIETLKRQIADKQKAIDLKQRELALEQDIYFSNPDHSGDSAGKEKLDALQSDLKDQQDELSELQAKLADLHPPVESSSSQPGNSETPAKPSTESQPPASHQTQR